MKDIILNSLAKTYTYDTYRLRLQSLLFEGKSSGDEQSEDLLHYSEMNNTRMDRLDKTMIISPETELFLANLQTEYIWLVLSESWCGDAAQILPIINKMVHFSEKIELSIIFRDENPELMNKYLTNGGRSIPKLLILNKSTLEVVADWGPRPEQAVQLIVDYKAKFGIIDEKVKEELQMWYLHDKGISTQNEIIALLKG
jgi:thiol-disulfide isomerase/thioredoxin